MGSERSVVRARTSAAAGATEPTATRVAAAPGKRTLVEALSASDAVAPVQLRAVSGRAALADPQEARAAALRGAAGTPGRLPHFEVLQRAFGPAFDLSQIGAHVGGPAAAASEALGAEAYAVAGRVVFRGEPTLHTAAHEVAHAIQQQRGVSPAGGLGAIGDAYEREADAVADAVVRGESVAALLGAPGTSAVAGAAVQLRQVARTEVRPELEPGDVDAERDGLGVIAGLQQQLRVPVTGAMDDPTVDAIIALQQRESLAEERAGVMTGATWEVLARLGSGGTAATTERGAVAARGSGAVAADQRRRVAAVQRALGRLDPRILGGLRELIARVDQSAQIRFFDALLATDPGELAHFVAAVNAARPAQLERLASAFLEGAAGPRALTGGPEAQRSLVDWNAQGGPAARVPDQLIQAHLADYATSAYLQEGEGEVLAEHYGVAARVLDQPTPSERIIRDNGVTLGSGGTVGHLLFVNGNHYIVLQPVAATAAAYDFIDLEHNKYTRGPATRARGDCLIEGLHLVAHGRLPSREEIAAARAHIASRVDREGVRQLLTAAITSLLAGEFPQGLGPQVFRRLRADEQLWTAFKEAEAAARERQRPAPQREGGAPGASAHEPVIGLPGVSYAGPVKRPTGEVIHRAECEVELINGVPYARLYLTICKEASLGAEQPDGTYAADWKDVQQDLESGKLQISPGSNGVMYVTAGQALRSLKWAAKYVVQHREKERDATQQADQADRDAQGYRDAHAALPWPLRVAWQLVRFLGNQVGLTEPSWPAMADGHATAAAAHRREASEMRGLQSPVIRSYLFPLAELNRITDDAILESEVGKAADPNKDKSYNVDRHAASNQYAFRGGDVSQLAAQARPGSLVTYAWDPQRVTPERSGELHPISDLYAKLGVPFHDPSLSPWTSGSSFAERDKLESIATDYNMYYVTWRQCPELAEDAVVKPDPLLAEAAAMKPYSARAKLTRAFLEQRKIPEPEWARYMEEQILPLASEPMKEHVIASDYERLNRDDNVRASGTPGFGNNYGQWRDDAPARARQLRALGARLDQLLTNGEAPHVLVEAILTELPALRAKYAKICTKGGESGDHYSFYEHAQMVLGQFLKIVEGDEDERRLISKRSIAKLVLFHDLEKINSIRQFVEPLHRGGSKGKKKKAASAHAEKHGEHQLTLDEMRAHRDLWEARDFRAVLAIADSDPFGDYLKGKITAADAFRDIVDVARRAGIAQADYPRFFREFHQFYQADLSSYSTRSTYVPAANAPVERGNKSVGQDKFSAPDEASEYSRTAEQGAHRLRYAAQLELRFGELAAMFADDAAVEEGLIRLVGASAPQPRRGGRGAAPARGATSGADRPGAPSADASTSQDDDEGLQGFSLFG